MAHSRASWDLSPGPAYVVAKVETGADRGPLRKTEKDPEQGPSPGGQLGRGVGSLQLKAICFPVGMRVTWVQVAGQAGRHGAKGSGHGLTAQPQALRFEVCVMCMGRVWA